jgi:hypothetical protein
MTSNESDTRTAHSSREAELPELAVRILSDFARIAAAEARLLESNIVGAAQSFMNRAYFVSVVIVLATTGVLSILGSVMLLLHRWMMWWQVLALVGTAVIVAAELLRRRLTLTDSAVASEEPISRK